MKGTQDHATLAEVFNRDEDRVDWHDGALWWIRQKRDRSANLTPQWEELREAASAIKSNVISNLPAKTVLLLLPRRKSYTEPACLPSYLSHKTTNNSGLVDLLSRTAHCWHTYT